MSKEDLAEEFALKSGYNATFDRMRLYEGFIAGWNAREQEIAVLELHIKQLKDEVDQLETDSKSWENAYYLLSSAE